ncbi:sodium-dependent glucose transporter [Acrasis kona]|uniref:Sodium-dependent glucose transporter n=1 Tax=Acrasis kona TaxID=1008807 RepID=A0AAW2YUX3_9EUKA
MNKEVELSDIGDVTADIDIDANEEHQIPESDQVQILKKTEDMPLHKLPDFKDNMMSTLLFCWVFMLTGISITILGPTLPQLALNVGEPHDQMGWVLTGKAITSILCNILTGLALDYFKKSSESKRMTAYKTLLVTSPFIICGTMCAIPFVRSLWLIIFINAIAEIGTSLSGLCVSVLMVWIWKERVNTPIQLLHFAFGVGGVVAPLIVYIADAVVTNIKGPGEIVQTTPKVVYNKRDHVAAAYVFSGLFCLTVIPLVFLMLRPIKINESTVQLEQTTSDEPTHQEQLNLSMLESEKDRASKRRIVVSVLIGLALFNYVGAEIGYGAVIYSYVVEWMGMATQGEGQLLTSVFWGSFTIGRLLAVPLSNVLSPKNMILIDILGGMISVTAILIFNSNMIALWVFTAAFGISLASQYPTTISLPASHMGIEVTGWMTATMVIFAGFGAFVVPLLMTKATLFGGPIAFLYVLFATSLIASLLYLVLLYGFKKPKAVKRIQVSDGDDAATASIQE